MSFELRICQIADETNLFRGSKLEMTRIHDITT